MIIDLLDTCFSILFSHFLESYLIVKLDVYTITLVYKSKDQCHEIIVKVFFIFAGFIGFSILYVRIFVPETKGKTIEEVQEYFSKDGNWGLLIFRIQKYDFIQYESFFVID